MHEREQIITFLLQQCDQKNGVIQGLQTKIAELEKRLAETPLQDSTEHKANGKVVSQ
jgi:hypothetical protein